MNKIIIISGPTGVGKTNISLKLAERIGGEIISADSMQVYKGFDIGSAKIMPDQMKGIKHHLIDILDPISENFDVALFQKLASKAIEEICARNKVPIIVGGTAFYIQALLYGIDFTQEDHDDSYREYLSGFDNEKLFEMLKETDPEYADSTHMNNRKRVIRALEYYNFTGIKFSEYNRKQTEKKAVYDYLYFVLDDKRETIYDNINKRVDIMVKDGLLNEAKRLYDMNIPPNSNARVGIGYKEMFDHLEGKISFDEAVELIKLNSRHYAKRQLTWLRHEDDTIFIRKDEFDHNDEKMTAFMADLYEKMDGSNDDRK